VAAAVAGAESIEVLFTREQEEFLTIVAGRSIAFASLAVL